jgi:hypothetical protein
VSRPEFLDSIAFASVGFSPFTRGSGRSVLAVAVEAAQAASAGAGLECADIDGIMSFNWLGDSVPSQAVATSLRTTRPSSQRGCGDERGLSPAVEGLGRAERSDAAEFIRSGTNRR